MGKKKIADDLLSVSIYKLNRDGFLKPGNREGVLGWLGLEEQVRLVIDIREDGWGCIRFQYFVPATDTHFDVPVRIEPRPCYYGGIRHWFRCGGCYSETEEPVHRSAVLYFDGRYFRCRRCCNVTYRSQLKPFHGVSVYDLDMPDPGYLKYKGKPTRRAKRLDRRRKKTWAVVDSVFRDQERMNQRFKKMKDETERKIGTGWYKPRHSDQAK